MHSNETYPAQSLNCSILKQELHDLDEQFTSLRYLSDELQIRARGLRAQKRAA